MARYITPLAAALVLAASAAATMPANAQPRAITLYGTVQRIGTHTIAVWEPAYRETGEWIVRDASRFEVGEPVTATGTEDREGHFYPYSVALADPYRGAGNRITLYGRIQTVGTNTLAVWEASRGETGEWVVPNAGRFRTGQRIGGTGTEDRWGRFYPTNVWIR